MNVFLLRLFLLQVYGAHRRRIGHRPAGNQRRGHGLDADGGDPTASAATVRNWSRFDRVISQ